MSFSDALSYPFKGENVPKVLTIILVFLLIVAVVVVGGLMMNATGLMLLAIPIVLAYSVFVGGYSVEVIHSVMLGHEIMPPTEIGRDIGRGIMTILASIAHMIPLIVFYICAIFIFGASFANSISVDSYGYPDLSRAGDSVMMMCGLGLAALILGFLLGYTYLVGLVRYAVEGSAGALFDIGSNFATVLANMGAVFGLLIRQIGIGIIYGILMGIVNMIFTGVVNDAFYRPNPDIGIMIGLIIYGIGYLSLTLMNQISSSHLIAGFGAEVGISARKSKHDGYDFNS